MRDKLEQLRIDFEKIKTIGELYEDLASREVRDEKELEEARLRYDALRNQALKISLHSKKIIQSIESEDIP